MTRTTLALLFVAISGSSSGCASSAADEARAAEEDAGGTLGANVAPEATPDAAAATPTLAQSGGVGFELRASVPYPRFGATAVLDTEHDRMIVYGGAGNDAWQLPLSGPDANRWRPLPVRGEHPPAHSTDGLIGPTDSAVYDAARRSMIVCVTPISTATAPVETTGIWELSLHDVASWTKLATLETPDGAELQGARAALDEKRRRLLLLGGSGERAGLWSLALDDSPTFTRLASAPTPDGAAFYGNHSLLLDAQRDQLVLFGAVPRARTVWAFDLTEESWHVLGEGGVVPESYSVAAISDPAHDRIVAVGGDEQLGVFSTFELGDQQWHEHPSAQSDTWLAPSMVLDAERDRALVFGGSTLSRALNETWALALDTLQWSQLNDLSTPADLAAGNRTELYDPVRDAVVAFGGKDGPRTYAHDLAEPSDAWTALSVGLTPQANGPAAIYDPRAEAILAIGAFGSESLQLASLPSVEGAIWQALDAGAGPGLRSDFATVYDAVGQRAVVFGGQNVHAPRADLFSDVWALSLGASSAWSQLTPVGTPPTPGGGYQAIYDAQGQRMLVFRGGITSALTLDGDPRWERLETRGTTPLPAEYAATFALYDPDGRRMIVLVLDDAGTRAFALSLDAAPTWHAFCPDTVTPARSVITPDTHAVLVPDGVFLSVNGASWRFDLATPYCG